VGVARAHEPITTKLTWTKEISRIVYQRCLVCHREGGRAPMSLATYDEARPWAKAIKEEVLERRMPPWGAVKGFGEFRNDASLLEREIELIAQWVEGGAPQGDEIYLPPAPGVSERNPAPFPAKKLAVSGNATLQSAVTALGIEPGGPIRATARLPDGSIQPLIWIPDRRPAQPTSYFWRQPLRLPKSTRVEVDGTFAQLLVVER
jgi:hypothetical protein